ncbi:MAG: hypothetical protein JO122_08595 [Acetobacteraceae bacterium]|nr:hypothetical protein [Acetobacteraceae bacterium]
MATASALFAVIRRYGPPYDPRRPLEAQLDWEGHRVFMNALEGEGFVRLGGPLEGSGEVLLVFRAGNEQQVEERLAGDPWTRSGILTTVSVRRWDLRIGTVA